MIFVDTGVSTLFIHGWVLWAAWSLLGFFQVVSFIYLRPLHCKQIRLLRNLNMAMHTLSGLTILGLTIAMSVLALQYFDWKLRFKQCLHSAFGLSILFAVWALTLLGGGALLWN